MATDASYQYAIYDNPKDYPGKFVVRRWKVANPPVPEPIPFAIADSLEDARRDIPKGTTRFGRFPDDDPCIVEVWW